MKDRYDLENANSPEGKVKKGKRARKKKNALLLSILVIVIALVSAVTIAFIVTHTDKKENSFKAGSVATDVVEKFENNVKKDVSIKNTGNTSGYIRAQIVVSWALDSGNVYASSPVEGSDYTITYTADSSWKQGADGFWYYTKPVDAGDNTDDLIEKAEKVEGANAPDGYNLSIDIIASSVQATPTGAVTSSWSTGVSGVSEDGILSIIES